eukprot:1488029-Pleurochrysis_carterae.AAC.1
MGAIWIYKARRETDDVEVGKQVVCFGDAVGALLGVGCYCFGFSCDVLVFTLNGITAVLLSAPCKQEAKGLFVDNDLYENNKAAIRCWVRPAAAAFKAGSY